MTFTSSPFMDFASSAWIPLLLSFAGLAISANLTLRRNARVRAEEAEVRSRTRRSTEIIAALQLDLKRLQAEAVAASAETASAKEHDLAVQLARIASQLEAKSTELVPPSDATDDVDAEAAEQAKGPA